MTSSLHISIQFQSCKRKILSTLSACRVILTLLFVIVCNFGWTQNFHWARTIGGSVFESYFYKSTAGMFDVKGDSLGNVYLIGLFNSTVDFDPGPNIYNLNSIGDNDIFILKLDSAGQFVWVKQVGSTGIEQLFDLVINDRGDLYLTGYYAGVVDFDPGAGMATATGPGRFILHLDSAGGYLWHKSFSPNIYMNKLSIDKEHNIYCAGEFTGSGDFDPGLGVFTMRVLKSTEFFNLKLDPSGNFIWAKQMPCTNFSRLGDMVTDKNGNIYTYGSFTDSISFITDTGRLTLISEGLEDLIIYKLNASGAFNWAKQIKSKSNESPGNLEISGTGELYLTGLFAGLLDLDPGPGTFWLTARKSSLPFILKLNEAGDFSWAKSYDDYSFTGDPDMNAFPRDLAIDVNGNLFIAGHFSGKVDFDLNIDTFWVDGGRSGVFISKYTPSGDFVWVKTINGTSTEIVGVSALSVSKWGEIHTVGSYKGTMDFDLGSGVFNLSSDTNAPSAFIHKMSQSQNCIPYIQSIDVESCDSFMFNNISYVHSGTYTQTFKDANGCDSSINFQLILNHSNASTVKEIICDSFIYDDLVYYDGGIYEVTLSTVSGCDSVVTLHLTLEGDLNIEVTQRNGSLFAQQDNALYQWIRCDLNIEVLPGATNQEYKPLVSGKYAVIVTNRCGSDTSDCVNIQLESVIQEGSIKDCVKVYPNPTTGSITIQSSQLFKNASIHVFNSLGLFLREYNGMSGKVVTLDISEFASGLYFVRVHESGQISTNAIIIND